MTAIRRVAPPVAVLAVLGTVLTACGSGPSQVNSAVIIGDRVISVDSVQQRLDTALKNEPAAQQLARAHALDKVSQGIVSRLVLHELVTDAAKREGLSVADKDVAAYASAYQDAVKKSDDGIAKSVLAAFDVTEVARDDMLTASLGRKYVDKLQLVLDGVVIRRASFTTNDAYALAKKMAAHPDQIGALANAAAGPADPTSPAQDRPIAKATLNALDPYAQALESGQQPPQGSVDDTILGPFFSAPENAVTAVRIGTGDRSFWVIARFSKDPAGVPATTASVLGQLPPDLLIQLSMTLGQHLLGPRAAELGIRVSPRYGEWDPLSVKVTSADEKIGQFFPVSSAAP